MFQPRNAHPLSLAEIASAAPSEMAVSSHSSRSDRYTYIPTSEVITGMAQAGFLPFLATQSRCRDAERRDFTKHMIRFRQMLAFVLFWLPQTLYATALCLQW